MTSLRKLTIASIAAFALGSLALPITAQAGDWNGPYAGVVLGYGSGDIAGIGQIVGVDETDKMKGATYGVLAGWNTQNDTLVFGFEGDISTTDIDGDVEVLSVGVAEKIQWNGNLRARGGFLFNEDTMAYVAGGLAVAKYEIDTDSMTAGNDAATFAGWTLGAGLETQLFESAKARIEYIYADYGTQNMFDSVSGVDVSTDQNIVRLGLVFDFGS